MSFNSTTFSIPATGQWNSAIIVGVLVLFSALLVSNARRRPLPPGELVGFLPPIKWLTVPRSFFNSVGGKSFQRPEVEVPHPLCKMVRQIWHGLSPNFQYYLIYRFNLGPISYFGIFGRSFVVLNDEEAINELFERRSKIYCSRPRMVRTRSSTCRYI